MNVDIINRILDRELRLMKCEGGNIEHRLKTQKHLDVNRGIRIKDIYLSETMGGVPYDLRGKTEKIKVPESEYAIRVTVGENKRVDITVYGDSKKVMDMYEEVRDDDGLMNLSHIIENYLVDNYTENNNTEVTSISFHETYPTAINEDRVKESKEISEVLIFDNNPIKTNKGGSNIIARIWLNKREMPIVGFGVLNRDCRYNAKVKVYGNLETSRENIIKVILKNRK